LFGEFLTWLAEQTAGIFFAATSNDVTILQEKHPEFFRAGRFDKIFWVDVPGQYGAIEELIEVIEVLKKKVPHTTKVDAKKVAADAGGYSGAEIEEALWEALDNAFEDNMREVTTRDVIKSLRGIQPITGAQKDQIGKLRDWASKAAVIANTVTKARRGKEAVREILN